MEFERVYGGLEPSWSAPRTGREAERLAYLAHAARAFFDERRASGSMCPRVFVPLATASTTRPLGGRAPLIAVGGTNAVWRARWPGACGNVCVETQVMRSKNIAFVDRRRSGPGARAPRTGAMVEIYPDAAVGPAGTTSRAAPADLRGGAGRYATGAGVLAERRHAWPTRSPARRAAPRAAGAASRSTPSGWTCTPSWRPRPRRSATSAASWRGRSGGRERGGLARLGPRASALWPRGAFAAAALTQRSQGNAETG